MPLPGDLLTRLSIWLALIAYAAGVALLLEARGRSNSWHRARVVWTLGCGLFLAHVVCAFSFFHHWSHDAAYRETARQTAELTGWNWGGGIYFNYAVAVGWLADVFWWWLAPQSFSGRSMWITGFWQGFLLFMVFNGAIVFGHGPVRVLGIVICLLFAVLFWRRLSWLKHLSQSSP